MKSLTRNIIIFSIVAPVSFGSMFLLSPFLGSTPGKREQTPSAKFVNNLTSSFKIDDVDLNIVRYKEETNILNKIEGYEIPFNVGDTLNINIDGEFVISNMSFKGLFQTCLNEKNLFNADFAYVNNYIYTGLNIEKDEAKIKFKASNMLDILNMLPPINFDFSSIIGEINMEELANCLTTIKDVTLEENLSNNVNVFSLSLPLGNIVDKDGNNPVLYFKANEQYEPIGIYTKSDFYFDCFKISIDVDKMEILGKDYLIVPPSNSTDYEDVTNIINTGYIIPNLVEVFGNGKYDINIGANVYYSNKIAYEAMVNLNINTVLEKYKVNASLIDGISTEGSKIDLNALYQENKTYVDFANGVFKGSISNEGVNDFIKQVEDLIDNDIYSYIIEKINATLGSETIDNIINNINSLGKLQNIIDIKGYEDKLIITVDTLALGIDCGLVKLVLNHTNSTFESININGFEYEDYKVDISITLGEYSKIEDPIIEEYSNMNSLIPLFNVIPNLLNTKEARLVGSFGIKDNKDEPSINDAKLNGSLDTQLKLKDNKIDSYGKIIINDESKASHLLQYKLLDSNQAYLYYDNAKTLEDEFYTKASCNLNSFDELYTTIADFINTINKDEPGFKPIANTIDSLLSSFEVAGLIKNILFNLDSSLLNISIDDNLNESENFNCTTIININANGSLLGLPPKDLTLKLGYNDNKFNYVGIDNLSIENSGFLKLDLSIKDYNESLNNDKSYSLDIEDKNSFYKLDDINKLAKIGCNTLLLSTSNYWKIDGIFSFSLGSNSLADVKFDIYVRNRDGKIDFFVDFNFEDLGFTASLLVKNDDAKWYYKNNIFFITNRSGKKSETWKISIDNVLKREDATQRIVRYVSETTCNLGFNIPEAIDNALSNPPTIRDSDAPMRYERILKEFSLNEGESYMFIGLNFAELANNSDMTKLDIKIYYDSKKEIFDKALISMTASVGVTLNLDFTLTLSERNKDFSDIFVPLDDLFLQYKDVNSNEDSKIA